MVQILSDEQLERLYCSRCYKYLSVLPIKNVKSGIKCGRCCSSEHGETSLYQMIVENYLFKCVNRYEGCNKLLKPEDVLHHERKCIIGSTFVCLKCECKIERSVLNLIYHYKIEHTENVLKTNSFECKFHDQDVMLYIQNDVIFFICYQYLSNCKLLNISAVTLTENCVIQSFVVTGTSFRKITESKPCKTLKSSNRDYFEMDLSEVSTDLVRVFFNFVFPKGVEKVYEIETFLPPEENFTVFGTKLTKLCLTNDKEIPSFCANCNNYLGIKIYACKNKLHFMCENCKLWCGKCDYNGLNERVYLADSMKNIKLFCEDCKNSFTNILKHQTVCKVKKLFCWYCEDWCEINQGKLHAHEHGGSFSNKPDLSPFLSFAERFGDHFVSMNNSELVHLSWTKIDDETNDKLFEISFDKNWFYEKLFVLSDKEALEINKEAFTFNARHSFTLYVKYP